jgi:cell fate (sporulation/competence/biofilm development) regulator YlbF (YheA/YmcA/DUF963 family)
LGEFITATPVYQAYSKAYTQVNEDINYRRLTSLAQAHRRALRWGPRSGINHKSELERLESEIEALPVIQGFRRLEQTVHEMMLAIDEIISEEAGIAFAQNAQRNGCGCGG